jgi:hypothetical protein
MVLSRNGPKQPGEPFLAFRHNVGGEVSGSQAVLQFQLIVCSRHPGKLVETSVRCDRSFGDIPGDDQISHVTCRTSSAYSFVRGATNRYL